MDFSSLLNGKTILVTGGTGSFGHQMVKELQKYKPKSVVIFSRDENKQWLMKQEFANEKIINKLNFIIGDVRDYDRIFYAMKDIDIVFHAAALKQVPTVESHPFEAVKTNIFGAYNVAKAATARNVKKVVSISTDKAVKPVNAMGMTKALQEKLFLANNLSKNGTIFACVRYGNVLGSRGSVIPLWDTQIQKNRSLPITHQDMTRFMLTLTQAIELVFYTVKNARGGEIFVKKAPTTKIVNLARAYAELKTGKKNYPLSYVGIRAGEKIHEILVSQEEMRHTGEKKDHFIIYPEEDFDKSSLKRKKIPSEYSSSSATMNIEELKNLMRKLKWIA